MQSSRILHRVKIFELKLHMNKKRLFTNRQIYIVITSGKKVLRTDTDLKYNCDPKWNATFEFIADPNAKDITFAVYDHVRDTLSLTDKFMGVGMLKLSDNKIENQITIYKKQQVRGSLSFSCEIADVQNPSDVSFVSQEPDLDSLKNSMALVKTSSLEKSKKIDNKKAESENLEKLPEDQPMILQEIRRVPSNEKEEVEIQIENNIQEFQHVMRKDHIYPTLESQVNWTYKQEEVNVEHIKKITLTAISQQDSCLKEVISLIDLPSL